jgi:hypothetical protein
MRNTTAKRIRKILPVEDATSKRVYRRTKKLYARLSQQEKKEFWIGLEAMFAA